MKALKITSRIFAILAAILVFAAILVAAGVVGSSNGFLDLSNVVAITILGILVVFSVPVIITCLFSRFETIKPLLTSSSSDNTSSKR